MADITFRVLDGSDRGRVFENLAPPITIGREEGNAIQLNDDRISRYHVKIQEDEGRLVLTDLESTNGTKVNGEDVKMRIMRHGDVLTVGRSVLLFGTRDQIALRLAELRHRETDSVGEAEAKRLVEELDVSSLEFELNWGEDNLQSTLHLPEPPDLPQGLSPLQAAQISELIEFLHLRIRGLVESVDMTDKSDKVKLEARQWQNLIDLQSRLAEYLRTIGDPEASDG